jgi:glutaredoxin
MCKMESDNMQRIKVSGENNKHKVLVYAISTCAWCKMTKRFLSDNSVEYEYVDVDLASDEDHEKIREDIISRSAEPSYPTIIVDEKIVITGFRKDKIKEALEL